MKKKQKLMFNLCKSRYQAVLLKQRWNELSQQYAKYQIAGEICVPSALNWNCFSYIFKNKSCSVIIQRALYKRHTAKEKWWPKRGPYQYEPLVRIVYKDNFKNLFQMTVFFLAYVVTFLRQVHFMRSFLFQNTHFFSAVIFYDYSYSEKNFYRPLLLEKR